ncbi:MAG: adenylosuccinate lyase [Chloroflexi bacterium RBG_16_56_8]|nr:MAG: adenylosuccinate lyase [Chloroflexi bacterium RBG_16_56_8]
MTEDALSPLDGRYARETAPLRQYFSEAAFLRQRVRVEIDYLLALSRVAHLVRPLTDGEVESLRALVADFNLESVREIKEIERQTRHDVKAIEYFLRARLASTSLSDIVEWLHFGLTSEDVNLTAQALALRDSRDTVILPALNSIVAALAELARKYQRTAMLARTHGQPAVPTTLGKEFAVFLVRLKKQRDILRDHRFEAKLNGAVGNFNALAAAAAQVDWVAFSEQFIRAYDLEPNFFTTQLIPYDNWLRYFDALRLTNSILVDLAQDVWRYISDDYLKQRVAAGEVGSSTMPQKVNPIDFENAEGNLGLANALFAHYAQKLAASRLQRDLSDSTVRRTFGVALGHTLLAYLNLTRGLKQIEANEAKLRADLETHWDVIAEGAQTILRAAGVADAYEQLKMLTRGKGLDRADYEAWVANLSVDKSVKQSLRELTPFSYLGLAEQLTEQALNY